MCIYILTCSHVHDMLGRNVNKITNLMTKQSKYFMVTMIKSHMGIQNKYDENERK